MSDFSNGSDFFDGRRSMEAEIASLTAALARAEAENTHWRTERGEMVSKVLYETAVKEQTARAEKAEAERNTFCEFTQREYQRKLDAIRASDCSKCGLVAARDAALARAETAEGKVREAVRLAGEKLRGKDITDQEVNAVTDLILREEHCIGWMTTDEMEAAQADVQIRDDQIEDLTRQLAAALARAEKAEARKLPSVGGSYVEGTLNGLAHRAQVHLGMEQEKVLPDNALIAVLCDTVRLVREWERHTDAYVNCQLAAARVDAVREFAEWEERDEVIVEDETHVEAAARYLSERVR